MKILHTADWHLGKKLEGFLRLQEQEEIMQEIQAIADQEEVDVVLIAGDLFDHFSPSNEAQDLFFRSLKNLTLDGKRAVVAIAGNHDSPDLLKAPNPLARACGIIVAAYPHEEVTPFELPSGLSVRQTDKGFVSLKLPNYDYPLNLILTPFANESRLKKYISTDGQEEDVFRHILTEHWQQLADQYFEASSVNVLMAHLFMIQKGGKVPEEPEEEKPILRVGGTQAVFTENLPQNHLQYVALGHLHGYRNIGTEEMPVVYSSSPLAYSFSEANQKKQVVVVDVEPGQKPKLKSIPIQGGKPLVRLKAKSVDEAVQQLQNHENALVELTMITPNYLSPEERKRLYEAHQNIITLIPQLVEEAIAAMENFDGQVDTSQNIEPLFEAYFRYKKGQAPDEGLMEVFKEVLAHAER